MRMIIQNSRSISGEKLLGGMLLSGFNDTRKMLTEKIGNYQSFEIADIMNNPKLYHSGM